MKRPIIASLIGGAVVASIAAGLTAVRLQYMRETKDELSTLPYGGPEKPLTWKNFFKNYHGHN